MRAKFAEAWFTRVNIQNRKKAVKDSNVTESARWEMVNCTVNSAFCANGFVRYAGSLHRSLSNQVKLTCSHGYFKNYGIRVSRISCMVYEVGY